MGIRIRMGKILGMGMIGSERGGDRVIGNYGMRREFVFFFISPCRDYVTIFLLLWLVLFKPGVETGARSMVIYLSDVIQ